MRASEGPIVVALSGNVRVGKSTLGEILATRLGATWISETMISTQFPHLISHDNGESKLVAEIAFAALRTAVILSHILGGCKQLVVERSLWEDWLFYELWRDRYGLHKYDDIMRNLFEILGSHPLKFRLCTIVLECRADILSQRAFKRNKSYDHIFSDSVISDLQQRYDAVLRSQPAHILKIVDVSTLDIANGEQVEGVLSTIVEALKGELNLD